MRISFATSANSSSAALAVFSYKDLVLTSGALARDASGRLARAARAARFDASVATLFQACAPEAVDASRLLVTGLGTPGSTDAAAFERIGGALAAALVTSGETHLVVDLDGVDDIAVSRSEAAAHIAFGILLRSWRFDKYRTKLPEREKPSLKEVTIIGGGAQAAELFARLEAISEGVFFARTLVSEPANVLYPASFVERARHVFRDTGVQVDVLDRAQMADLGMNALLGVAQGSVREPQLLIMRWDGSEGRQKKPAVFVGKGVTFDTGGISLKPPAGMEDMKWDMGGAAAVSGALLALAKRKSPAHVIGVCGLVENMPDGGAQRPGDVVSTMSGQTVEVINTDAEGRLVLCDALWWAQTHLSPGLIVDLATLTGAIIISLAHEYAGVFPNDDELSRQLQEAGEASGDRLWPFPMGEAFDKMLNSDIADMKNVGDRKAGSITAAQFLARFIKPGIPWAHLDIAGMAWANKAGPLYGRGATGFGVRLLDELIARHYEST